MNREISVQISDVSGKSWSFEGLKELLSFLDDEASYWKEKRESVTEQTQVHAYLNSTGFLEQITNTIKSWDDNLEAWDESTFTQQLQNLKRSHLGGLSSNWLWSGHPYSSVYVECHKEYSLQTATSFIDLVLRQQVGNITKRDNLFGVLLAYEFLLQDSDLTKRRNGEKASLEQLRGQLEKTTTQLIIEVEDFKKEFSTWDEETQAKWAQWLESSSSEHISSQGSYKDEFRRYMDDCRTRISDLENTYQEKLRLEKPATYWKQSARKYGIQGGLWSIALIAAVIVGFMYFSDFFSTWLEAKEIGIKLNTIQGIILFGSVVAIYAFLIRTLSRLTFSSFHLMRDAEEREQLTYLYLALNNENNIDASSRDIVLQALFSRSETGLLASESGPTMPGVSEILKSVSRTK